MNRLKLGQSRAQDESEGCCRGRDRARKSGEQDRTHRSLAIRRSRHSRCARAGGWPYVLRRSCSFMRASFAVAAMRSRAYGSTISSLSSPAAAPNCGSPPSSTRSAAPRLRSRLRLRGLAGGANRRAVPPYRDRHAFPVARRSVIIKSIGWIHAARSQCRAWSMSCCDCSLVARRGRSRSIRSRNDFCRGHALDAGRVPAPRCQCWAPWTRHWRRLLQRRGPICARFFNT